MAAPSPSSASASCPPPSLKTRRETPDGPVWDYHFHGGQYRAWNSEARFLLILAGTQGGKTVFGPPWLLREIERRGPGDYLGVAPAYPLMQLKMLPEFLGLFGRQGMRLGEYNVSERRFTFGPAACKRLFGDRGAACTVFFGHAQDPDSLESATAKAAWLDEAGQGKFRLNSWEAVQRRLSVHQGRALITTTPYNLGWLRQQVFDRWQKGDPDYQVIQFDSVRNPAFPRAEFERARATLPAWKFDMFYRGRFTRPAGLIYDAFDALRNKCPRFEVPPHWPRFLGLDFGGVNTAAVYLAEDPGTLKLYCYREYHAGGRTAAGHAAELLRGEPGVPVCAGGAKSEQQWRDEFAAAGLPVHLPAVADVEVGIDRVYGALAAGRLVVFEDLARLLDELGSYSRVVDDAGNPTEEIDDKSAYHLLDALRYIVPAVVARDAPADDGTVTYRP